MDTISRENNSMLPIAGVIVGALGLIVGAYAAYVGTHLRSRLTDEYDPKIARIDDIASQASSAQATASQANAKIDSVAKQTQDAFNTVANSLGSIQASIVKLQEGAKTVGVGRHGHGGGGGSVVAGPGEYIVKSGDSGARIARANGVALRDLLAVNPEVNWKRLKVGQKIKLPESRADQSASAPPAQPAPAPQQ
jgi:LysM repeat protein